jgi:N6-L-threonylcarbamoyladenine synthase
MLILGIETSCDETAAAVVRDGRDVLSNAVYSQIEKHAAYGGVVPEIAARAHVEKIASVVEEAMAQAGIEWGHLDAVAVTRGPGLASSLLVGLSSAKALALRLGRPLVPVNHLEGHLYSVLLGEDPGDAVFPMLVLLVSGGHSCVVRMDGVGRHCLLGQTLDDAAGEALDKGATVLGLGYPGGPAIERAAKDGDPRAIRFPRGLEQPGRATRTGGLDARFCFSFSGIKTSLLYRVRKDPACLEGHGLADVAASYQESIFEALLMRVRRALEEHPCRSFACVGGVARNQVLRGKLDALAAELEVQLLLAHPEFCTDNAAMIAGLAGASHGPEADAAFLGLDVDPNLSLSRKPGR